MTANAGKMSVVSGGNLRSSYGKKTIELNSSALSCSLLIKDGVYSPKHSEQELHISDSSRDG